MTPLLWLLRLIVALAIVALFSYLARWCGPDIEVAVAPVLDRQRIVDLERWPVAGVACFTWRFDKVKHATAVDASWTLRGGGRVFPYQAVVTVADSGQASASLPLRPVEPGQWSRKCITIPRELARLPFSITGSVEYATAATGQFWTIRQPTPSAEVR